MNDSSKRPATSALGLTGLLLGVVLLMMASCGGAGSNGDVPQDSVSEQKPDSVTAGMVNRAIADEAKRQLTYFCNLQDSYFNNNHKYAASPLELQGFTEDDLKTSGSIVNCEIKLVKVHPDNFLFHAIADDMDGDGTRAIWEVDKKCNPREVVAD